MIFSQEKLLSNANDARTEKEAALNAFIQAWQEEQARKVTSKLVNIKFTKVILDYIRIRKSYA